MLAHNPKTGKELRIINLETSVWRDQKTLVWLDAVPLHPERWNRWDVGTADTAVANQLQAAGITVDVVVCLDDAAQSWLEDGHWAKARLVVVTRSLVKVMGMDKLLALKMSNLLCLDEIHDLYPFTGSAWDGSVGDAKALIALALHFGRTFPVTSARKEFAAERGLKVQDTMETPQELWFVTQYYKPSGQRREEIDACLKKNIECPIIDRIVLLNEKEIAPKSEKIREKVVGKRLTYADVIRWIYEEAPEDVIVAFANADIFLDADSWRLLWSTDLTTKAKFLALLRWEVDGTTDEHIHAAKLFGPRPDSQDTWVLSSNAVKAAKWDWSALDFPFGQSGCDNAITVEIFKKRFLVANPALSLRTYHYHTSQVRNYDPHNIVDKPAYLYIQPTGLHDMRPVLELGPPVKKLERKPFARPVRGPLSVAQAKTFCAMVKRSTDNKVVLEASDVNMWEPPAAPIYQVEDVFQTREGLVYTYDTILVGKSKTSSEAWSESQLSSMSASLAIDNAMIAPLPNDIAKDSAKFILQYMSKVFWMREEFNTPEGEFWCAKDKSCVEAIKMFNWPNKEVPVLSRDENLQTWCKRATVWHYEDIVGDMISKEEVAALRKNLGFGGWTSSVDDVKRIVFLVDDTWITEEMAERIEEEMKSHGIVVKLLWPGKTSLDICIRILGGAWGVVMATHTMAAWAWVLPEKAFVWELQSEMAPNAALLHLAGAADLHHRLLITPKGSPNQRDKDSAFKKLTADMKSFLEPVPVSGKPQLILPTAQSGFYGHAGDSFREMARIWAERGYVEIVEKPVCQVWLGGVGETLLYDRPTYEWLERVPDSEKAWKRALFGNPVAVPGGKAWTFWPRKPSLVEELVAKGLPMKSYEAREKTLVFYGRSENAVQRERRTGVNWEAACDDFSHRISTVDKYTYTHTEYLERLANAKYGLCLAGYGNKCHREIECMAMGCVPIVAPEVDMSSYAEPPEEGLHYFRVKSPEEARVATSVTPDRWIVMSAACRDWWQRNASADGSWALTQRLSSSSP
jgi:hypothetical protein